MSNLSVTPILDFAVKQGASDIHITEGSYLIMRVHGELTPVESTGRLEKVKVNQILLELLGEQKDLIKEFVSTKDLNFNYTGQDGISFRINAYYKLGKIAIVMRKIEGTPRSYDELMLPQGARTISELHSGLVIISGASGSGKSTTVTSVLDVINRTRSEHIITLEDPVEYIHKDNKSIFSQRNIGRDTQNIKTALKSVLREDPNVVMIGDIDSKEILEIAINMAKSGILVITTVNATSVVDMMNKLIGFYDAEERDMINSKLSSVLSCAIFQQLIKSEKSNSRLAVFEVMLLNTNIELMIKAGKLNELPGAIHVGLKDGMTSSLRFAETLVEKGLITEEFKDANFTVE